MHAFLNCLQSTQGNISITDIRVILSRTVHSAYLFASLSPAGLQGRLWSSTTSAGNSIRYLNERVYSSCNLRKDVFVYEGIQCRSVNLQVQVRGEGRAFVRAEQNRSDRQEEKERGEGEKFAGFEGEGETRRVGRVTGKAAGSAGVCTTDTCLDSITGLGSHSFLPIKTEKTDLPLPPPLRKSTRAKSSYFFISYSTRRIGNCFEPPRCHRQYHPPFAPSSSSSSPLRSSFLAGPQDTSAKSENTFVDGFRMGWGLADAFYSFISSVIHLFPIRARKNASTKCFV